MNILEPFYVTADTSGCNIQRAECRVILTLSVYRLCSINPMGIKKEYLEKKGGEFGLIFSFFPGIVRLIKGTGTIYKHHWKRGRMVGQNIVFFFSFGEDFFYFYDMGAIEGCWGRPGGMLFGL